MSPLRSLVLGLFLLLTDLSAQEIHTTLFVNIPDDRLDVSMKVPSFDDDDATFCLPAWAPGNYRVLNFGKWIQGFSALDTAGLPLPVIRVDINTWHIKQARRLANITYSVLDIPEDSVEALPTTLNDLDSNLLYFNATTVFGYFTNKSTSKYNVRYLLPSGWRVWCALPFDTVYHADSYDQLVDSPVLAGDGHLETARFMVDSTTFEFVVSSAREIPVDSLIAVTEPVVRFQASLFGGLPFRTYFFLMVFSNHGTRFGALEHRASSAYYLPQPSAQRDIRTSFYSRVLAHELFHAWLPKRIHPKAIEELNYQDSLRIKTMWVIEGITEYYAKLSLVRSGILPPSYLYQEIRGLVLDNLEDNLETLSLRSAETGVAAPMYTKGALMGLLIDIEIRRKTKNRKSLDDVLKYMDKQNRVYDDNNFSGVVKKATGVNIQTILNDYVKGSKYIPVEPFLRSAGIRYDFLYRPFFGWTFDVDEDNRLFVTTTTKESTSDDLKLESGDIILEIQHQKLIGDLDQIRESVGSLEQLKVGESVRLVVLRNDKTLELQSSVRAHPTPELRVVENTKASPAEKKILNGLLGR